MRVAFLVNDLQLSGGVGVVVQHARRLSLMDGWEVTLALARDDEGPSWHGYEHLAGLQVCTRTEALAQHFDIVVATWWETAFTLFELAAERYAYFVQSLEDRFYPSDAPERLGAALTLDLPLAFITEAQWIADTLAAWRPDVPCHLVRNGIDKAVFGPVERVVPSIGGPLRILVEGSPRVAHKRVPEAVEAVRLMKEPHELTVVCGDPAAHADLPRERVIGPLSHGDMAAVYAEHEVVVKLSSVEGMFGPPLEGFHRGATCVVTPVTGHDEYVEHGYNGLLTDWDDLAGTARQLDLLARDRQLLHYLRENALATARAWPSWEQASQFMAGALLSISRSPVPAAVPAAVRLTADLRAGIEVYGRQLRHVRVLEQRFARIQRVVTSVGSNRAVRWALRIRHSRAGQIAVRPLRPLKRRLRRTVS